MGTMQNREAGIGECTVGENGPGIESGWKTSGGRDRAAAIDACDQSVAADGIDRAAAEGCVQVVSPGSFDRPAATDGRDVLETLSKEQLIELLQIYAKNLLAMDGVWFQSIEGTRGMDEAMYHDIEAWKRFTVSEGKRIKGFLGLPEHPGLEGLAQALSLKSTTLSNISETLMEDDALIFRIVDCRVQTARERKGMPFHPCKPAGVEEYGGFARTIDDRIACEPLSCFPDITDTTCNCSWRFTLEDR